VADRLTCPSELRAAACAATDEGDAMFRNYEFRSLIANVVLVLSACTAAFTGCERKERVLDVQTPGGDVQVDRNLDTGEVEIDVTDKD
jgi:hypothetical protein